MNFRFLLPERVKYSYMVHLLRTVIPNNIVNILWHLPKGYIAAFWHGLPANKLKLIGVTGTDGKTTTTHLIYHILKSAGKKVAFISSVAAMIGDTSYDTGFHVTSPDSWDVQRYIKQAVAAGCEYMVLEVTSHALSQYRFAGCRFHIGVLTNVTPEHLDYHKTYKSYALTKFTLLQQAYAAVVNKDDESYRLFKQLPVKRVITYGLNNADITPNTVVFKTKLRGLYNTYNCMAAIAAVRILNLSDKAISAAVSSFTGVPGRLEVVYDKDFTVIIDFAHTSNSFAQVLPEVKKMGNGRLIHVFGCAAARDRIKRPIMGRFSAQYANNVVLTEEDYRQEDITHIFDEIEADLTPQQRKKVIRIPNRQEAISYAITKAQKGDVVLVTGKAHEKSLCRGTREYPWDEFNAIKQALHNRHAH